MDAFNFWFQSLVDRVNPVLGTYFWYGVRTFFPNVSHFSQSGTAVYILVTTAKDGRSVTSLERKIPLVTIKALSMSNLRDDWMVSAFAHIPFANG